MNAPDLTILHREITSRDDAEAALAVLAWLSARRAEIAARTKLAIAEAKSSADAQLVLDVDGVTFRFDDIERALTAELLHFADAQRASLFEKKKTAQFTHGQLRARKRPAGISIADGETEESVLPRVIALGNPRYLRVKQSIDFATLKTEREKGLIGDEQLAELGLVYEPGGADELSVVVAK